MVRQYDLLTHLRLLDTDHEERSLVGMEKDLVLYQTWANHYPAYSREG